MQRNVRGLIEPRKWRGGTGIGKLVFLIMRGGGMWIAQGLLGGESTGKGFGALGVTSK